MDSVCEGAGACGVPAAFSQADCVVPIRRVGFDGRSGALHHPLDRVLGVVPADHVAGGYPNAAAASETWEPDPVSPAAGTLCVLLRDAALVNVSLFVLGLRSADSVGGVARRTSKRHFGSVEVGLADHSRRPEEAALYPGGTVRVGAAAGAGHDFARVCDALDGRQVLAAHPLLRLRSRDSRLRSLLVVGEEGREGAADVYAGA